MTLHIGGVLNDKKVVLVGDRAWRRDAPDVITWKRKLLPLENDGKPVILAGAGHANYGERLELVFRHVVGDVKPSSFDPPFSLALELAKCMNTVAEEAEGIGDETPSVEYLIGASFGENPRVFSVDWKDRYPSIPELFYAVQGVGTSTALQYLQDNCGTEEREFPASPSVRLYHMARAYLEAVDLFSGVGGDPDICAINGSELIVVPDYSCHLIHLLARASRRRAIPKNFVIDSVEELVFGNKTQETVREEALVKTGKPSLLRNIFEGYEL